MSPDRRRDAESDHQARTLRTAAGLEPRISRADEQDLADQVRERWDDEQRAAEDGPARCDRYGEGVRQLAEWLHSGELRSREEVVRGDIEHFPRRLAAPVSRREQGKLVLAPDASG